MDICENIPYSMDKIEKTYYMANIDKDAIPYTIELFTNKVTLRYGDFRERVTLSYGENIMRHSPVYRCYIVNVYTNVLPFRTHFRPERLFTNPVSLG